MAKKKNPLASTDAYGRAEGKKFPFESMENVKTHDSKERYERFFAGYTEYKVVAPNGGKKTVRVYTGNLFRQEMTVGQARRLRVLYVVLFLLAAAVYIASLCVNTASNSWMYTVLAALIPAIFYARLLLSVGLYALSSPTLKIREYRDGSRVIISTPLFIIGTSTLAVAVTVFSFWFGPVSFSAMEIVKMILLEVSAALTFTMRAVEKKVKYTEVTFDTADNESVQYEVDTEHFQD